MLGGPYAKTIKRSAPANIVNSWRVAHVSLPIGATLMLAVAALLPSMTVPTALPWVIAMAFIVSALWHPSSGLLHWSSPRSCLCKAGNGPDRLKSRMATVTPPLS
jgi:hypothetical protein